MRILLLVLITISLAACGGSGSSERPLEQRIIGKWSGIQTNAEGDKFPATWEFIEGGTMIVKIIGVDVSYGAKWSAEGSRINFTTELAPDEPNYRDVEFVSEDVIKLKKEGIEDTWTRVEE